ncbi:MAG: PepSY domain-containing protein [Hyphomicrobiaceae bacterium]|jgi:uncharacterized membrane protein YkoI|nr:PepSY domain-containing protein [Methyloceanibacter sp.]MDX2318297.1 PepSY domain-containing protein [Hyphomicrobiaceae bacterium]MDX2450334.1 PepSY domain-containing protein [Hyphomicrobiaceae bacterium]
MRVMPILLPVLFAACLAASPASARIVDIETVRAMAFDKGIVEIEEIELHQRKGVWKVEGEDATGHEIEMKVDARTGQIIKLERD